MISTWCYTGTACETWPPLTLEGSKLLLTPVYAVLSGHFSLVKTWTKNLSFKNGRKLHAVAIEWVALETWGADK